jgi:hypothetical protein
MDATRARTVADDKVGAVANSASARLALAEDFYRGEHAHFGRAELSFLRWEIDRGVLDPVNGSPWWRAVNNSLLRDKTEAATLVHSSSGTSSHAALPHGASSPSTRLWLEFLFDPTPTRWYRAHNCSIVNAYLKNEPLAHNELPCERLLINVALMRVIYAHALLERPHLALGKLAWLGPRIADPRGGSVGFFLDLHSAFPQRYPLTGLDIATIVDHEGLLPRVLDTAAILPRLAELYDFAATTLDTPGVASLHNAGIPSYAGIVLPPHAWEHRRRRDRMAALVTRVALSGAVR